MHLRIQGNVRWGLHTYKEAEEKMISDQVSVFTGELLAILIAK